MGWFEDGISGIATGLTDAGKSITDVGASFVHKNDEMTTELGRTGGYSTPNDGSNLQMSGEFDSPPATPSGKYQEQFTTETIPTDTSASSVQAFTNDQYGTMSTQASKQMSERADYYDPQSLGDQGTKDLMGKGYSVTQSLAEQYKSAQDSKDYRAAAYYKNEYDKSLGSAVALSSEYHHEAQDSGLPTEYNRFEWRGDIAKNFLENSQGVDNTSANLKGNKQPNYSASDMLKNANIFTKAERTVDSGGYDKTSSFSSGEGRLSLERQGEEAAKAGKWTHWNVDRTPSGEANYARTVGFSNPNFLSSQGIGLKYREAGFGDADVASVITPEYIQREKNAEFGVANSDALLARRNVYKPEVTSTSSIADNIKTVVAGNSLSRYPSEVNDVGSSAPKSENIKNIVSGNSLSRYPSETNDTGASSISKSTGVGVNNAFLESALVKGAGADRTSQFDISKISQPSTPSGSPKYGNAMITKVLTVVKSPQTVVESNEPVIDVMANERKQSAENAAVINAAAFSAYTSGKGVYDQQKVLGMTQPSYRTGGLIVGTNNGVSAVALPRRAKKSKPQIKREVYIPSTLNVLNNVLIPKSTKATVLSPKGSGVGKSNFNGMSESFLKNSVKMTGVNIGMNLEKSNKKSTTNNLANNINDLVGIIKKQKPTNTTKSKRK